jgi:hypothetical protein
MSTRPEDLPGGEPTMDPTSLYREDIYTDRKVGALRMLTPVTTDGSRDLARPILYVGEAQLLTTVGALPLSFEIEAKSLDEAVGKYAAAAKEAFERAVRELQEMRRQAASSIVIPDRGAGGFGPGGGFPPGAGGLPGGGGRIRLS